MQQASAPTRSGSGSALRKFGVGLLLVALFGLALWWQRSAVVQWLLQQTVLTAPRLSGLFFDTTRTDIADLAFGFNTDAGALTVELKNLSATYDLQAAKIQDLNIAEATLKFVYRPADPAKTADSPKPISLPLERLRIAKLALTIDSPWGQSRFAGAADIHRAANDALTAALQDDKQTLNLQIDAGFNAARFDILQSAGKQILALQASQLNQPNRQIRLNTEPAALANWLNGNLLIPDRWRAMPAAASFESVAASVAGMQFNLNLTGPDTAGKASGHFTLGQAQQPLLDGEFELAQQPTLTVDADIKLQILAAQAFALAKPRLPASVDAWQISGGEMRGVARLRWQAERELDGSANLQIHGLDLTAGSLSITNATLAADLPDLARQAATVTAGVPNLGLGKTLTAQDLQIKVGYQPLKHQVDLEQAKLSLFAGTLALAPGHFSTLEPSALLTVLLEDIDLSQLLTSLDYPDISGTGKLTGSLPVTISKTGFELEDGELTGTRPGVLRYRGKAADPNNLAFQALRNLAYHGLQAKLSYRPNGDYRLGLRLEGHNPEVLSGHPLAFNLNISGQLPELLQKGLLAGDFERAVIQQASTQPAAEKNSKPPRLPAGPNPTLKPPPAERRNP